jgi:hypothetical protein
MYNVADRPTDREKNKKKEGDQKSFDFEAKKRSQEVHIPGAISREERKKERKKRKHKPRPLLLFFLFL